MKVFGMEKRSLFLFLGLIVWISSCRTNVDPKMESARIFFENISGTWKLEGKPLYEAWTKDENNFKGNVYTVVDKDTLIRERVDLLLSDTVCVYRVQVKNQNEGKPIDFMLRAAGNNMVFFENPEHDFPTSIRYELKAIDTLLAQTSGIIDGKTKTIEFLYHRE
jgi:hypothetical protein